MDFTRCLGSIQIYLYINISNKILYNPKISPIGVGKSSALNTQKESRGEVLGLFVFFGGGPEGPRN